MSDPLRLDVDDDAAGQRLDRFLAQPLGSRSQAQALIDAGAVLVDGRTVPKRHLVAAGEEIVVTPPRRPVAAPEATPAPTSPPGWSCTRPAGIGPEPSPRRWRDAPPVERTPGAPGSSTAWTATPQDCSSSRARTRSTGC
jgi:23S rRNA pseudouridine1911/1915/1917 synthase